MAAPATSGLQRCDWPVKTMRASTAPRTVGNLKLELAGAKAGAYGSCMRVDVNAWSWSSSWDDEKKDVKKSVGATMKNMNPIQVHH